MIEFRVAQREDCALILSFIQSLAKYEKLEGSVIATEQRLEEWLFDKMAAEVIFAVVDGKEVGFALYFTNFSTFLGKAGLYLEDLFVLPEYRGRGIGKALLKSLAQMAEDCDFGRMEWVCLDWNTDSIEFYKSIGAQAVTDWSIYRLSEDAIKALANNRE
ncbi:MAG: GNAT family N-acetyltransferase [Oscillospiraceae bacterium]|nr:GNAT family N-acetyltransferase [Oscillospiraceae bacterium]